MNELIFIEQLKIRSYPYSLPQACYEFQSKYNLSEETVIGMYKELLEANIIPYNPKWDSTILNPEYRN